MTEKFVSPCPPPTPYERELLEILIEECAEVIQRATKMLRFGVQEVQPGQGLNNAQRLSRELGDLHCVLALCGDVDLVIYSEVLQGERDKERQLEKYMQTSKEKDNVNTHNG